MRRATTRLGLEGATLVDTEAVLLVDHDQTEVGEGHRFLDERVGADDDVRLARSDGLERLGLDVGLERAGQEGHADPELGQQRPDGLEVLTREQVGRREEGALETGAGRGRQGVRGDRGLARPDVALEQSEHRGRPGEIVADGVDRDVLVDGQLDRLPDAPADRVDEGRANGRIRGVVDRDLRRGIADPLPAPRDHPELEGEQLVEGEAAQGGVAVRERVRVVGLLDRPADRHEPFLREDLGRQVLGVGEASLVDRLPDGRAQADRGEAARQSVDRDDPAGVEQLRIVDDDLELGVVEGQPAAEVLDLARDHDLGTHEQPAFDEAPSEPGGLDAPCLVLEPRDRPLGAAPEPGLDADVADRRLGRDDRAVRGEAQIADLAHLAQVVVAPGQVEQEIADGIEVELDPRPPELGARRPDPSRQRGRQELDRVGRDGCADDGFGHAYSAEMRYR